MKQTIIILLLLFAGWKAAVFIVKLTPPATVPVVVSQPERQLSADSTTAKTALPDTVTKPAVLQPPKGAINTNATQPQQVVDYAKTLIGVPYLYGSTNPEKGFDCSGFITYVFNHFGIAVPRSSVEFTNVGTEVTAAAASPGDLILFTGTDSAKHFVGHMGIVVSNTDTLRFIHATSGRQHGVTITPLSSYYKGRYVKTVRLF